MKLYRFLSSLGLCLLAVHMTHTKNVTRGRGVQYQELTDTEKESIQKQRAGESKRLQEALKFDLDTALKNPAKGGRDFVTIFELPYLNRDYTGEQINQAAANIEQALQEINSVTKSADALNKTKIEEVARKLEKNGASASLVNNFKAIVIAPIIQTIDEIVVSDVEERAAAEEVAEAADKARVAEEAAKASAAQAEAKRLEREAAEKDAKEKEEAAAKAATELRTAGEEAAATKLEEERKAAAEAETKRLEALKAEEDRLEKEKLAAEAVRKHLEDATKRAAEKRAKAEKKGKKAAESAAALPEEGSGVVAEAPVWKEPSEEEAAQALERLSAEREAARTRRETERATARTKSVPLPEDEPEVEERLAATPIKPAPTLNEALWNRMKELTEAMKLTPRAKPVTGASPEDVPAATAVAPVVTPVVTPAPKPVVMHVAASPLAQKYIDLANNPRVEEAIKAGQPAILSSGLSKKDKSLQSKRNYIAVALDNIAKEYPKPESADGWLNAFNHSPKSAIIGYKNEIWKAGKDMDSEWKRIDESVHLTDKFTTEAEQEAALDRIINHYLINASTPVAETVVAPVLVHAPAEEPTEKPAGKPLWSSSSMLGAPKPSTKPVEGVFPEAVPAATVGVPTPVGEVEDID